MHGQFSIMWSRSFCKSLASCRAYTAVAASPGWMLYSASWFFPAVRCLAPGFYLWHTTQTLLKKFVISSQTYSVYQCQAWGFDKWFGKHCHFFTGGELKQEDKGSWGSHSLTAETSLYHVEFHILKYGCLLLSAFISFAWEKPGFQVG